MSQCMIPVIEWVPNKNIIPDFVVLMLDFTAHFLCEMLVSWGFSFQQAGNSEESKAYRSSSLSL